MKRIFTLIFTFMYLSMSFTAPVQSASPSALKEPSLGALPLLFVPEENGSAPFSAAALGGHVAFQSTGLKLSLTDSDGIQIEYLGANPETRHVPSAKQPTRVNRFLGSDPDQWRIGIPTYATLTYKELYPGIDLRYDGQGGQLKGTFTVNPGTDPASIRWHYEGAKHVEIEPASGDLQIALTGGQFLTESAPIAWQVMDGHNVPVKVRFTLEGNQAGFTLGAYDASQPLVIDPTLTYSTFLGGISSDYIDDISLDSAGNIYVGGWTYTNNLGGLPNTLSGTSDAFVARLNTAGTAWQWITYVGGNQHDEGYGVAAGSDGIWLTGYTDSANFPTTPDAFQSDFGGFYDVILVRLDPANGDMTYSTLFGFDNLDEGRDVALDGDGNVYVTGQINQADVLVMKFSAGVSPSMTYAVQWGDDFGHDIGYALAVDEAGQVYVTGVTEGAPSGTSTFPIVDGIQSVCGPYDYGNGSFSCTTDAFISVLNAAGDDLIYSTLLGGGGSGETSSGSDEARGIALDQQGNIYVTGHTYALDFPTVNAAFENYPDPTNISDGWVTKISADGQTILYSTYLGGDSADEGTNIVADNNGNAYILGFTRSTDFPVLNAIQPNRGEGGVCFSGTTVRYCHDAFLTKLSAGGSLTWSTYLGGGFDEYAYGLVRDNNGALYLSGVTESPDYPTTTGAVQESYGANEDGFITRISDGSGGGGGETGDFHVFLPLTTR